MTADTREPSASAPATVSSTPAVSTEARQLEASSIPVAPPNANALPAGAGQNTAGGKPQEAGFIDALRSIKPSEIKEVHKKPCVRDSLLTGIGGGFGIGGVRAIWGGTSFIIQGVLTTEADSLSYRLVFLQLGCWLICIWLFPDVRVLPEKKGVGEAGHETGCGSDRSEASRKAEKGG